MKKRNLTHLIVGIIALFITFFIVGIQPVSINEVPPIWYVFFGGIVGISGLLLPGISGSFILLLLGLYRYIIQSVESLGTLSISRDELIRLIVFSLGIITGFIFFVRVIMYFYKNYKDTLLAILSGIILGSLRVIYPFFEYSADGDKNNLLPFETSSDYNILLVVLIIILGGIFVFLLSRFSETKQDLL